MSTHPLRNWIPRSLYTEEGEVGCRWLFAGDIRFDKPFFEETIAGCLQLVENSRPFRSLTSLETLVEAASELPAVAPSAFIFHVSRCGSTLLSQLLTVPERHIVLPEVPLIDAILRLPFQGSTVAEPLRDAALQAVIRTLGQVRTGRETHLFVKLDSWNVFFYQTLRRLYPEVPFVLLYRSPDEVLRSHQKQRGMQAVPGVIEPAVFGFTPGQITGLTLDEYTALVLERYYRQFLTIAQSDPLSRLVNYTAGPESMLRQVIELTDSQLTDAEWSQLRERSHYHSKRPDQPFAEAALEEAAPPFLKPAVEAYTQLETYRCHGK